MTTKQLGHQDVWEKWEWLWRVIFYTAVLGSFVVVLLGSDRLTPHWVTGLLTGGMLLWHWGGLKIAYRGLNSWGERPARRFIVIAGDILLWFILVNISPAYYITLFGLFIMVFRHLPVRFAVPATLLLTAGTIFEQLADSGGNFRLTDPAVWPFLFMALASILLGVWISLIIEQSTRRRQLIEQLEVTQADLAAAEHREGVLQERQRLAREIHDTLAQGFTSIVMHLETAEQALPAGLDRLQKHLDMARSTARTSLDEARRVVQDLRPDLLEGQSLLDAIERSAARWSEESRIPVTTSITGTAVPLHPNIEVTLLRVAQEALHNIYKHARASDVQLTLSYMDDVVVLDVQDDGVGIGGAEPSVLSGGYGLQAMRERVEGCGGKLSLESEPGEGTTVVISIPIAGESSPQEKEGKSR